MGSGMVNVSQNTLHGVVNRPDGQLLQTLEVPENFSFIPHPISSNSWPTWYYDKQKGGAQEITVYEFDDVGRNGGVTGSLVTHTITYVGEADIVTPAGNLKCDHFVFGDGEAQMYFFGPHRMLAKMTWGAANFEFVLSEYRVGP